MIIQNPILRGFHPDPSIVRVGEDYYIATSTFEWWPGVRLHHSRDLIHWELIGYALTDASALDLRGVGPSQGIWAPCLTYDQGTFYLVYTVVKAFYCNMYDTHNYLVTATDIHGSWSEPVSLNNFGFDPSLFHDSDGRKYMVSMVTDHRVPKKYAGRLVLQEYDSVNRKMTGPVREIYQATDIFLEGPHIFRRKDWYYLFCADTGTGELHGQTILRSKSVWGPYEMYRPEDPYRKEGEAYSILTSRNHPELPLQKAGHCDLVETMDGEWYAVHLCGRPVPEDIEPSSGQDPAEEGDAHGRKTLPLAGVDVDKVGNGTNGAQAEKADGKVSAARHEPREARRYMLGRETAIQKMCWTADDWLVMADGGNTPRNSVEISLEADAGINVDEWKRELQEAWLMRQETSIPASEPAIQPEGTLAEQRKVLPGEEREVLPEKEAHIEILSRDEFDLRCLHPDYQSLRIPMDERFLSLEARPGWLRMYGRSGLASRFEQTLIARRMTEYDMEATTCVDFNPDTFKQMAGLILMYDTDNYLYLHISRDEDVGKCITLLKTENRKYEYLTGYLPLEEGRDVILKLCIRGSCVQFSWGYRDKRNGGCEEADGGAGDFWQIGPLIDASFMSDEACREGWFTGTMIGICCQDLTGFGKHADFDWFEVKTMTGKAQMVDGMQD